jgi:hypothetical protein
MRKLLGRYKLVGYSLQEIRVAFEHELTRVRELNIELATDDVMSRFDLVNAVFLWFLTQPSGQRDSIVRAGSEDFRRRRLSDKPLPLVRPDGIATVTEPTHGRGAGGANIEPKKRKPKRANLPKRKPDH